MMELTEIEKEMFGLFETDSIELEQPQKVPNATHDDAKESDDSSAARGGRPQRKTKSKKNIKLNRFSIILSLILLSCMR